MKKKIIIALYIVVYILGVITTPIIKNITKDVLQDKVIYNIVIDREYINLRSEVDLSTKPVKKVYKGEKFQVIDYYEGNVYNWYKVIYDENKIGFIASAKDVNWVIVEY